MMLKHYEKLSSSLTPRIFDPRLKEYREEAMEKLRISGFPGRKVEHWMKFDISHILTTPFIPSLPVENERSVTPLPFDSYRLQLFNGRPSGQINRDFAPGIHVADLSSTAGREKIDKLLGEEGDGQGRYFYNLNGALFDTPLLIEVKGEIDKPLFIEHIIDEDKNLLSSPTLLIHIGEGAHLQLVETYSHKGCDTLFNGVSEISLEEGAELNHLIAGTGGSSFHSLFIRQEKESLYRGFSLISSSPLSRHETTINLAGEGALCETSALFLGKGTELHDSDLTINHMVPRCKSRTLVKAIGRERTHGVFRAFVRVSPGAKDSDAQQQFHSLILSDEAQINSEPHLEIFNDEVKCSHGATVGKLDEEQLFYLQSRGYSPEEAKSLLLKAFTGEFVEKQPIEGARKWLGRRIDLLMVEEKDG